MSHKQFDPALQAVSAARAFESMVKVLRRGDTAAEQANFLTHADEAMRADELALGFRLRRWRLGTSRFA